MIPAYKPFLNRFALKRITRDIHLPDFSLGIYPYEILTNVTNVGFARTMPDVSRNIATPDLVAKGQSYAGLPGWGDLTPEIETGGDPYYGEPLYKF